MIKLAPANRAILNTMILYIKLVLGMIIGLFTTRLVLGALGEIDYGIYVLVAGVVGMLAFLQGVMAGTSMRFIAHSLGSKDSVLITRTFNTTLSLHILLGIILMFILEIGGAILFERYLNIPNDRIFDAKIVFHFMVLTTFISVISVPYDAILNAYENIFLLSVVDLVGSILNLSVAVFISYYKSDQLIIYGVLVFSIQFFLRIVKQFYCRKNYPETKINFKKDFDRVILKQISSLSGWTLLGAVSSMASGQLQSIFLNMFFGVRINAANGIANTSAGMVNNFSNSITTAIRPQLIKNEGSGDRKKMLRLTEVSIKFSIFLFALIGLPVFLELPYLLRIWLTTVPEYSIIFGRLILIATFLGLFSFEISTAIMAVGKIRSVTLVESGIIILSVIIGYIAFSKGFPPYSFYVIVIIRALFVFTSRCYFGKVVAGLNITKFFKNGLLPVLIPLLLTLLFAIIPQFFLQENFTRLLFTVLFSIIPMLFFFRVLGLTESEYGSLKKFSFSAHKTIINILRK